MKVFKHLSESIFIRCGWHFFINILLITKKWRQNMILQRYLCFQLSCNSIHCYLEQNFYNLDRLCILCNLIVYQDGYLKENISILIKAKMFLWKFSWCSLDNAKYFLWIFKSFIFGKYQKEYINAKEKHLNNCDFSWTLQFSFQYAVFTWYSLSLSKYCCSCSEKYIDISRK